MAGSLVPSTVEINRMFKDFLAELHSVDATPITDDEKQILKVGFTGGVNAILLRNMPMHNRKES